MNTPLQLDVLIASYGTQGLERLSRNLPPRIEGVRWLVSSQIPDHNFPSIPENLCREDIVIQFSASKGLSHNRNLLLDMAEAPLCLIADDDLIFSPEGINAVINTFAKNPDIDIATFMYALQASGEDGTPMKGGYEKPYPDFSFPLEKPAKGYYVSAIEIAFRREALKEKGIRFNEYFGINARYQCGEDSLFLHDALSRGLKGKFFPVRIVTHPGLSTGVRMMGDPGVLLAQGVLISRLYPATALPRLFLKAWRSARSSGRSPLFCLGKVLRGGLDYYLHRSTLFPFNPGSKE